MRTGQIRTWDAREADGEKTIVVDEDGPDAIDRLQLVLLLRDVQEVAATRNSRRS